MDISINRNPNIDKSQFEQTEPAAQQSAKPERPVLSITHAQVSSEDTVGLDVPESALRRDDELGNLVNAAFSLPAPPMPKFE